MKTWKRITLSMLAFLICHFSIYIYAAFNGVERVPSGAVAMVDLLIAMVAFWLTGSENKKPVGRES